MAIPIPICNYSNHSKISVIKSPNIPLLSSSNKISIPFSSPLLIDNHELPPHWQLLPSQDLQDYLLLKRQFFEKYGVKSKKGKRLDGCNEMLSEIRRYIEKSENNKWKRSIVCGVIFLQNSLAINIQQLRILIGKCKSSINGSFQQMGYVSSPPSKEIINGLLSIVPLFQNDSFELKKWTIRKLIQSEVQSAKCSQPALLPIPVVSDSDDNKENQVVSEFKRCDFPIPQISLPSFDSHSPSLTTKSMKQIVQSNYPCPIKYRYKYTSLLPSNIEVANEIY